MWIFHLFLIKKSRTWHPAHISEKPRCFD